MSFCEWYVNGFNVAMNVGAWCLITYTGLRICCFFKACIYNLADEIMNKGEEENVEMGE